MTENTTKIVWSIVAFVSGFYIGCTLCSPKKVKTKKKPAGAGGPPKVPTPDVVEKLTPTKITMEPADSSDIPDFGLPSQEADSGDSGSPAQSEEPVYGWMTGDARVIINKTTPSGGNWGSKPDAWI